ncbi:MAG: hypothetical protein ABI409_04015 [Ramlibacter sp.]
MEVHQEIHFPQSMNTARISATLLSLATLAAVSGCTTVYEGKYDFRDGWRKARVGQIIQGAAIVRPEYWQCWRDAPSASRGDSRYALLLYSGFGRARQRMVPVPSGLELQKNETVFFNLGRCEGAIVKRGEGQSTLDPNTARLGPLSFMRLS